MPLRRATVPDRARFRLRPHGRGRRALPGLDSLLALEKSGGLHLPAHEGLVMATHASAQALLAG